MGRTNQRTDCRVDAADSANRALKYVLPAVKRAAPHPERFTATQRKLIIDLLLLAMASNDRIVINEAVMVAVACEGEDQRRDRQAWATGR